jgi:hypothetical protein
MLHSDAIRGSVRRGKSLPLTNTILLIGRFFFQVLIGALLFLLIGGVAWGLSEVTEFLKAHKAPWHVYFGVELLSEFLFAVDGFLFLAFVLTEAYMLLRLMWRNVVADGKPGGNNAKQ